MLPRKASQSKQVIGSTTIKGSVRFSFLQAMDKKDKHGAGTMSDDEEELDYGGDGSASDDSGYNIEELNDMGNEYGETVSLDQTQKNYYTVLKEEEIVQLEENEIARVSTVLSIPKAAACFLLCHFNWKVAKLHDQWFADEDGVRHKVGLFKEPVLVQFNGSDVITCGICFDDYTSEQSNMIFSAGCGHPFCRDCWTGYIRTSINEGSACLMLTCPEPSCKAAVDHDLISVFISQQDHEYERRKRYLLRSYVEHSTEIKWCPAPGCDYAVKFDADAAQSYDVLCLCSNGFCWNCTEEIHRPVDCGTVAKWILKNKDDSQCAQWILVNTKPCPKCKRAIEKNQGCNHMTCREPCGFRFCWLCLKGYEKGHCHCNRYQPTVGGDADGEEREKKKLKEYLQRYIHYYERWANNKSSKQKALEDFHKVQTVHIQILASIQDEPDFKFNFIKEAWQQIIECRQVLQWTYAYGYFIPENEHAKGQLFEYLQGQAEFSLERLHRCAEKDLKQFFLAHGPKEKFNEFHFKLVNLTKVTGDYFKKLVRALENGLSEVDI